MRHIMIHDSRWVPATRHVHARGLSNDGGHLRVLLVIAAMLLALALGIDDQAVDWMLGREPARFSAQEEHHLEEVRYLLTLDAKSRSGAPAHRR